MMIRRIHVTSFGPLTDFDCELYSGMNVVRGDNESGKTSLAMFIKFMLYGLSGRAGEGNISERKRYVNWTTGQADGYIIAEDGERSYRIERTLSVSVRAGSDRESTRETLSVTDTKTGARLKELEECPGMAIFGVPETVFVNTVFSGQSGRGRVNGADTAAAVENLLFSADETVSVKKAADVLDKHRRTLMHKNGSGGEIPALRERCRALRSEFDEASAQNGEIIELESAVEAQRNTEKQTLDKIQALRESLRLYNAARLVAAGEDAAAASREEAEAEGELRVALSLCCDAARVEEARAVASEIERERAGCDELRQRITELETGAAAMAALEYPEEPEEGLKSYRGLKRSGRVLTAVGTAGMGAALVAGAFSAVFYFAKQNTRFLILLALAAVFAVIGGVMLVLRGGRAGAMRRVLSVFEVRDEEELSSLAQRIRARRAESVTVYARAEAARISLDEGVARLEALETEARMISASFEDCLGGTHPEEGAEPGRRLADAISLALQRRSEAEIKKNAYENKRAIAAVKWENISREKLAAAGEALRGYEGDIITDGEAARAEEELSFSEAMIEAIKEKRHNLEVRLASRKEAVASPAVLWEELSEATERLEVLTLRHDAVTLAAETLAAAGENMRRSIIPRIVARASDLFSRATGGRYESLGAGGAFAMNAVSEGHTREIAMLSAGTEDLAYLCLRVALAGELFGAKKPPLIFDETLAFMDPERRDAAKVILEDSGHQVLLFTCRPEDAADHTLRLSRR